MIRGDDQRRCAASGSNYITKKVHFRQIKVGIHSCLSREYSLFGTPRAVRMDFFFSKNHRKDWESYLVF